MVKRLRLITLVEGLSLLLLLGVAMPLKYGADLPLAVRIAGSAHGLLYVVFIAVLWRVATERAWPWRKSLVALALATVPFGCFVLDRRLRAEQ